VASFSSVILGPGTRDQSMRSSVGFAYCNAVARVRRTGQSFGFIQRNASAASVDSSVGAFEEQGHSAPMRGPHNRKRIASLDHGAGARRVTLHSRASSQDFELVYRQNYPIENGSWLLWSR
jgi:hypothetical protein